MGWFKTLAKNYARLNLLILITELSFDAKLVFDHLRKFEKLLVSKFDLSNGSMSLLVVSKLVKWVVAWNKIYTGMGLLVFHQNAEKVIGLNL